MRRVVCMLLLAVGVSVNGLAQKGMQGIGISAGMSLVGNVENYEGKSVWALGAKYQYSLSDHFRVEPAAYFCQSNSYGYFDFGLKGGARLSAHYVITTTAFRPYLIARVDYGHIGSWGDAFGYGGGAGLEYRVSYNFALQCEFVATQFNKKDPSIHSYTIPVMYFPALGLTYNF